MHTHAFRGEAVPPPVTARPTFSPRTTSSITHPGPDQHVHSLNPEPYTPLTLAVANISSCDGAVTGRTEEWWCEIFHAPSTCGVEGVSAQR